MIIISLLNKSMNYPSVIFVVESLKKLGAKLCSVDKYSQKELELFSTTSYTTKYVYNFERMFPSTIDYITVHYIERVVEDPYSILSNPGFSTDSFNNITQSRLEILIMTYDQEIYYYRTYNNIHLTEIRDNSLENFINMVLKTGIISKII